MTYAIFMDITRCTDCRACEVACEREHNGRSHMRVQVLDERYAVPMNCRHCQESPCTTVCPTQAMHREEDGIVTIAAMKCIGCQLCVLACPFGAIQFDTFNKISRKCDLCLHRLEQGLEPACVATCSARALMFGDFDELAYRVAQDDKRILVSRAAGKTGTLVHLPAVWDDPFQDD